MKDEILKNIIDYARKKLTSKYGYSGVCIADNFAMLNSGDEKSNDIIIKIELKKEG